jgi:hypothetical protein
MNTEHAVSGESSVMFNLRQLMELETERLSKEAEAVRSAQRAAEQQRTAALRAAEEARLAEERAAAERAREAEFEAQRIDREREASLLRARLQAESNARLELERLALERDRIALEHARAIQRQPARGSALRRAALAVSLVSAAFVGGALHAVLVAPQPSAAEAREVDTRSATATLQPQQPVTPDPRDLAPADLQTPGHGALETGAQRVPQPSASELTGVAAQKLTRASSRPRVGARRPAPGNGLEDIDLASDDPLEM